MLFLPTMKVIASFLLILFTAFLATPTFVVCIDENVDISMAFTASEEENSSKTQLAFEFNIQDVIPGAFSGFFSQDLSPLNHSYKEGYRLVFLDVLYPPPKQA